ncbi:MAG: Resolvase domain [Chthonomonadales bacterium]|nr:Resolvase domain [Chthonomonadales bacterium]
MRFALYARKSTEGDERQSQSIADQKRRCLEAGRARAIHDVVVVEESRSAKEEGRPEFRRMLAMADAGEIDGILAWHPDRLSRNEMDAAAITMRLRKGILKDMLFVEYYFHNSPEGIMMLQFALSQSQYYSSKLVVDVKRGLRSKLDRGLAPYLAPPGYVNNSGERKGQRTISPDPLRFPLVRRAFDHVLSGGYTPAQVHRLLNGEWGYRTPADRKYGDSPMSKPSFYRMLVNPFYAGFLIQRGTLHQGMHHPMITLEEHDKLKKILGVKVRLQPKRHFFPYTGVIHCRNCGYLITAYVVTNQYGSQYNYYRCLRCREHNVSESILQKQIDAEVKRIHVVEPEFLAWAREAVERFWKEDRGTDRSVHEQQVANLASVKRQLDALLTALTKGLVTEEEYVRRKEELTEEHNRLLKIVTSEHDLEAEARTTIMRLLDYVANVREWMTDDVPELRRACLRSLGSNFLLDKKTLLWEPNPLLVSIRDNYNQLSEKYRVIKLKKTLSRSAKQAQLESVRYTWCDTWYLNQTIALEQQLSFPDLTSLVSSLHE